MSKKSKTLDTAPVFSASEFPSEVDEEFSDLEHDTHGNTFVEDFDWWDESKLPIFKAWALARYPDADITEYEHFVVYGT